MKAISKIAAMLLFMVSTTIVTLKAQSKQEIAKMQQQLKQLT
ncbi:hypothetical protein [Mucilaginibacter phenanthrenivorans]|nr:hypothetical protein [Mucilaginibacter phenanthrenivorans]